MNLSKHHISWYIPGRTIYFHDYKDKTKYYKYKLVEPYGKNFSKDFKPAYTPLEMLKMGVFEGKYLNDREYEFPIKWFEESKNKRSLIANPKLNYFGVKSRMSFQEWEKNGWLYGEGNIGWFYWYCQYFIGRRTEFDEIQINRWKKFKRHYIQLKNAVDNRKKNKNLPIVTRFKQRQALLQWSWQCILPGENIKKDL